jgi:hypothetical protein
MGGKGIISLLALCSPIENLPKESVAMKGE